MTPVNYDHSNIIQKKDIEDCKTYLYKNLEEVLLRTGNSHKTLPQENDTIYLKVEENSLLKNSTDLDER